MSHCFDAVCQHGTVHGKGCPEWGCTNTSEGRSPHGSTTIECPTPSECKPVSA